MPTLNPEAKAQLEDTDTLVVELIETAREQNQRNNRAMRALFLAAMSHGWSESRIARQIGLDQSRISQIIRGAA